MVKRHKEKSCWRLRRCCLVRIIRSDHAPSRRKIARLPAAHGACRLFPYFRSRYFPYLQFFAVLLSLYHGGAVCPFVVLVAVIGCVFRRSPASVFFLLACGSLPVFIPLLARRAALRVVSFGRAAGIICWLYVVLAVAAGFCFLRPRRPYAALQYSVGRNWYTLKQIEAVDKRNCRRYNAVCRLIARYFRFLKEC